MPNSLGHNIRISKNITCFLKTIEIDNADRFNIPISEALKQNILKYPMTKMLINNQNKWQVKYLRSFLNVLSAFGKPQEGFIFSEGLSSPGNKKCQIRILPIYIGNYGDM